MNKENPSSPSGITRREFFRRVGLLGGGLVVYISFGDSVSQARDEADFNAYLRIGADGRVTCFSGKIEMGQGIITSLAQMLADELRVPFDSVDMVLGDTSRCPWDMGTFGSMSTRVFGQTLRRAAAVARTVLLQMAAERLGAEPDKLTVQDGVVMVTKTPARKISYAELTKGKRIERHVRAAVSVLPPSQRTVSGKAINRSDSTQKVTGKALYAGDIRVPGMLYARILRPPAHGAKLVHLDTSAAKKTEGVRIIRDGDLVAVLHPYRDAAERALERIKARYEIPEPAVDNRNLFDHLIEHAPAGEIVAQEGDLQKGIELASTRFDATYLNRYVAHAPMEPHTAVVHLEGEKATVWASTQAPFRAAEEGARVLGLPGKNVRVITPFVGGGFGGKTRNQQVIEAARLAKLSGRPVQVAWSRKEEFMYDTFRPAAVIKVSSGLDGNNRIVFWDYDNYFAGERSSTPFYHIPHYRVRARGGWMRGDQAHPFAVGAWRGPGSNTNVFAMESHMDIMAESTGMDPLAFRLKNLTDERMVRLLEAAAEKFGRPFEKAPSGKGFGMACTDYHGTYVATMAEVQVDGKSGEIKVKRVVCAQDMGEVINPAGAVLQMEGCVTMGLGYALREEVRFRGGEILDENFDTYELPRFSWLPEIETVLVDNPRMPPQGGGEPAITPMGAVLANAVYDAVGKRLFELPMTPERVIKALNT